MYGFCRLGLRPVPSTGATWVSNGLETKTSTRQKYAATAATIGTVHGRTSATSLPVEQDGGRSEPGQDQDPEEE